MVPAYVARVVLSLTLDPAAGRPAACAAPHPRAEVLQQLQHTGAHVLSRGPFSPCFSLLSQTWLTTYIWGIIYLRNQDPLLFDGSCVRLFKISFAD